MLLEDRGLGDFTRAWIILVARGTPCWPSRWQTRSPDRKPHPANLKKFCRLYPDASYGGSFLRWAMGSNGAAMRISPAGYVFDDLMTLRSGGDKPAGGEDFRDYPATRQSDPRDLVSRVNQVELNGRGGTFAPVKTVRSGGDKPAGSEDFRDYPDNPPGATSAMLRERNAYSIFINIASS